MRERSIGSGELGQAAQKVSAKCGAENLAVKTHGQEGAISDSTPAC